MKRDFQPSDLARGGSYRLLTATVLPRPIAWVSSRSAAGVDNLAPHSFFTVASGEPPIVQFVSVGRKDTLDNVEATGEFVVNFTTEPLFEQVNDSSTDYPATLSEFDELGIEREPSRFVASPRVAAAPVAIECTLHSTQPMGDSTLVFGNVVDFAVDPAVLADDSPDRPHPLVERLRPLARLGKNEWTTLGTVLDKPRKKYADLT